MRAQRYPHFRAGKNAWGIYGRVPNSSCTGGRARHTIVDLRHPLRHIGEKLRVHESHRVTTMRMPRRSPVTESPPIARQYSRFVGEFVVSLAFTRFRTILDKSLILLARPTGFEPVTSAFGGQNRRASPSWASSTICAYDDSEPFPIGILVSSLAKMGIALKA
jgi:hypothetical protein